MKAAFPHRRLITAGAGPLSPVPAIPPEAGHTIAALEARVLKLEALLAEKADAEDIDTWLYSAEGIAEFKFAIRRLAFYGDKGPLTTFTNKTNGRVPHLLPPLTRGGQEGLEGK